MPPVTAWNCVLHSQKSEDARRICPTGRKPARRGSRPPSRGTGTSPAPPSADADHPTHRPGRVPSPLAHGRGACRGSRAGRDGSRYGCPQRPPRGALRPAEGSRRPRSRVLHGRAQPEGARPQSQSACGSRPLLGCHRPSGPGRRAGRADLDGRGGCVLGVAPARESLGCERVMPERASRRQGRPAAPVEAARGPSSGRARAAPCLLDGLSCASRAHRALDTPRPPASRARIARPFAGWRRRLLQP
jgi:hypothetical protein